MSLPVLVLGSGAESPYDLNPADVRVLGAIADFWAANAYAPAHRELAAWAGLHALSHVRYCLRRLAEAGLIRHVPNVARSVALTEEGGWALADEAALEAA